MKRVRVVKEQMKAIYGNTCMLTGVKSALTFHHVFKKCYGGEETIDNGALLCREAHDLLHEAERNNKPLYEDLNECLQLLKQCIEQDKTECLEEWEEVKAQFKRLLYEKKRK